MKTRVTFTSAQLDAFKTGEVRIGEGMRDFDALIEQARIVAVVAEINPDKDDLDDAKGDGVLVIRFENLEPVTREFIEMDPTDRLVRFSDVIEAIDGIP